jgi:hypothetical protein
MLWLALFLNLFRSTQLPPPQTASLPAYDNYSTFGTLIGALGNSNGIVVFTDSRASYRDQAGIFHHLPGQFQKLMRFDDRTVCAIAGLGSAKVHVAHELDSNVLGVVESVRDELQKHEKQSILFELRALSASLTLYLDGIAELNGQTGYENDVPEHLQMLLVGYDVDGLPKIGALALNVTPQRQHDGRTRWSTSVGTLEVVNVEHRLVYMLGGMPDVANQALKEPTNLVTYKILEKYRVAKDKDRAASFSLEDLEELGRALVALTAEKYPEVIGGDRQIAVLSSGQISRFVQPTFTPPTKPFSLAMIINSSIPYPSFPGSPLILFRGDSIKFYEGSLFYGPSPDPLKKGHMSLDSGIFVDCTFKNMVLWYNGGTVFFDVANKAEDSELAFGADAFKHPDKVRELQEKFNFLKKP